VKSPLLFAAERSSLVQVAKTALAGTLAWVAAALVGYPKPFFATLAALLAVQPSIVQSLTRGLERFAGVIGGVTLAYVFGLLFGVHVWTVGLLVLAGLLLGWLLRLGPQGAVQIPISALLVVAIGAGSPGYIQERILETALGAAIGAAINAIVVPPVYVRPVTETVTELADSLVDLLHRIAAELGSPDVAARVVDWLAASRELTGPVEAARSALARAEESLRWNPVRRWRGSTLDSERDRLTVLTRVSVQVRGIARTLHDHLRTATPSPAAIAILRDLIDGTARAVARFRDRAPVANDEAGFAGQVRRLRAEARQDPSPMWTVYGALAEDLRRIRGEVSGL
jgi:uncharacterized membrane protein YgaE (UPF0421/DUF939 family)